MRIGCSRSEGRAQALTLPSAALRLSSRGRVLTSLMLTSYVGQQEHPAVIHVRFHSLCRGHPIGGVDSNGLLGLRIFLLWEYGQAAGGENGRAALCVGAGDAHLVDQLDFLAGGGDFAALAADVPW